MSISQIKRNAKQNLSEKWGLAIGLVLVFGLLVGASSVLGGIGPLILTGPMTLGLYTCYLKMQRNQDAQFEELFSGFNNFGTSLTAYILIGIYTFLWSLLLIIPGIIKSLSYSMTWFILIDNPNMSANEAITRSRVVMDGHKTELFVLYLSFFGWFILCILTLGILFIYVYPYMYASLASFYQEIKTPSTYKTTNNTNFVETEEN